MQPLQQQYALRVSASSSCTAPSPPQWASAARLLSGRARRGASSAPPASRRPSAPGPPDRCARRAPAPARRSIPAQRHGLLRRFGQLQPVVTVRCRLTERS
ncbi:hypothetical protein LV779_05925 [Streptomyces thinghirensis]|nr:hypothetical protein [Streptomyces thinghirensis]